MSLRQLHHLVRQVCRPLPTTTFHADPALDEQRISAAVRTLRKAKLLYPVVRPGNRRVRSTDITAHHFGEGQIAARDRARLVRQVPERIDLTLVDTAQPRHRTLESRVGRFDVAPKPRHDGVGAFDDAGELVAALRETDAQRFEYLKRTR